MNPVQPSAQRTPRLHILLVLVLVAGAFGPAQAAEGTPDAPADPAVSAPQAAPDAPADPAASAPQGTPDAPADLAVSVAERFRLHVPRLKAAPVIDGQLDDAAWSDASVLSDFVQTEPADGAPATRRTEVRVGYDSHALYVAFRCEWANPESMVALSMSRDSDLDYEDHVEIALDTFQDRQNAFLFRTNPFGARVDGIIRDNGEDLRYDWDDAFWSVATTRDKDGWTAEFSIPFNTLRFKDMSEPVFGANFGRFVAADHEVSYWKPMPHSRGLWSSRYKVANYAELSGFSAIERRHLFDARPYVFTGATRRGDGKPGPMAQFGIDVKIPITSSLTADLTFNPDFADAEADEQQLNLTRFPLLLPEKREFFKEGASLFYFGDRVVDTSNETLEQFIFFQSRQIGLAKGGQATIPVLGGARITGKVGELNVGLLNLTSPKVDDPDTTIQVQRENYTVMRLRYDFANSSSLGVMGLNKQGKDGAFNRGVGIDGNLVVTDYLRFGGYLARTFTHDVEPTAQPILGAGGDIAGSADAVLQTQHLSLHALYTDIGQNFRPDMGYLTRPNIRKAQAVPILTASPGFWGLKQASFIYDFNLVWDREWSRQTMLNKAEILATFTNGYAFAIIPTVDEVETLTEPFAITGDESRTDLVIPAGTYDYRSLFFGFGTDLSQPYAGILWLDGGKFYNGKRFRTRFNLFARPVSRLGLQAIYDREQVWLPQADFTSHIVSVVANGALSPTISSRLTFQYASENTLRASLLANWNMPATYAANVYLVVDKQVDLLGGRPWLDALTVAVKLNFTWGPAGAPRTAEPVVALSPSEIDGRGCATMGAEASRIPITRLAGTLDSCTP